MSTIVTNPVLLQPQNPGDIVDVQLQNTTSSTQASGEITFGQTFADGDLPAGAQLIALINGQQVPVQMDVKTTNPDGSVRFAVLTVDAPAIAPNAHVDVMLAQGTPSNAGASPVQIGNIVSQGYNTTVDLTLHNADGTTSPVHVDVAQLLTNALQSGHYTTWMQGPLATEVQITAPISGSLQAQFNITAYADGKVSTDVVMGSQGSYQADANTDHVYDIAIHSGGQTVFQQSNLDQVAHTTWHEQFWSSGASVAAAPAIQPVFDMAYLEKTGAIPALDLSLGVDSATLDANVAALNASNTGPEGSALIDKSMPDTGGRPDIGELTTWEANYIETQDPRALQVMTANANAAGSVPWHFNDPATGQPVSIVDHPNANIFGGGSGNGADDLDPSPTNTNGFSVDTAHQPELTYIAYLTTGNPYYLQELQAQANFSLLDTNPAYRGGSEGLVTATDQLRGEAWSLRELADAAFISPDSDPMQAYFTNLVNNNVNYFTNTYVTGGALSGAGELQGWLPHYPDGGAEPPWMDDYMATALSQVAKQGFAGAGVIADWMVNFEAGRFLNGANGFNPMDGAAYHLNLWSPADPNVFSGATDPGSTLYSTWAQVFQASLAAGNISSTPDMNVFTIAEYYPMYARGALAELFNATGSLDALAAFGFLTSVMNANADLQTNPKWDFMPQLHDGNFLQATQLNVVTGSTGSTFAGMTNDLLIYDSGSGNDTISGGQGINVLFAGSGSDTLVAGANGDYLFAGVGADQLIGGSGNDVIVAGSGSSTMTGHGGNDTFLLREGGGNVSITDFHAGDTVTLEHYSVQNFTTLQPLMVQSGNNVVVNLDGGQTLTFLNHALSDFSAANFSFSGPVYTGQPPTTTQTSSPPPSSGPFSSLQAGTWTDVANSHLADVVYNGPLAGSIHGNTGPSSIMSTWSGGTFDPATDSLIVWGGGHQDYAGNEVYAFSLQTLRWTELSTPSSIAGYVGNGILPDGTPASRHTYDGITFLPNTGQMFETGGSHWLNGNGDATSWLFDPTSGTWQQAASTPNTGGFGDVVAYDPVSHNVFEINNANGLQQYDPAQNIWSSIGSQPLPDYHQTGAIDPVDHILVTTGLGFLQSVSLTTGAVTNITSSGDQTVQNGNAPGFVWDSSIKQFVGWDGGANLYTLDPHTWQWTVHPAAATNTVIPTAATDNGTFGRFAYDAANNVFVVVNDINQDVFIYKPDFGSATSTGSGSTTGGGATSTGSSAGSTTGSGSGSTTGTGSGGSTSGTSGGSGTSTASSGTGGAANSSATDPTTDSLLHHLMPSADVLLQALLNGHAQDAGHLASVGHPGFTFAAGADTVHAMAVHSDWLFHV